MMRRLRFLWQRLVDRLRYGPRLDKPGDIERGIPWPERKLIYAAYDRCSCGAGLAYVARCGRRGYWDCSAILTGRAMPEGAPGAVRHTGKLPFVFYEIKSEQQPSVKGATTRPLPVTR